MTETQAASSTLKIPLPVHIEARIRAAIREHRSGRTDPPTIVALGKAERDDLDAWFAECAATTRLTPQWDQARVAGLRVLPVDRPTYLEVF